MQLDVAYRRRSAIVPAAAGLAIALSPNLRRDRVSFSGTLHQPLRFREAMCALHDVVISDLRYKPKDNTAYQAFLQEQQAREASLRTAAYQAKKAELQSHREIPMPDGLEADYRRLRKRYWDARQQYSDYIARHDPQMWRLLMPCDPVITVAPDVLFFECFSADESSYGCLSVDREAFRAEDSVALGTTNVDYSWALYEHFQQLRSYRETRFEIDPAGFEVQSQQAATYREEKIDLPMSWLRGFMQLQAAMSLPMRRVTLNREAIYNVLAWLKRHKARQESAGVAVRADPRPAGGARAGAVGSAARAARHSVCRPAQRDDPHLGPRPAAGAGPAVAAGGKRRRVSARHGPAELLGGEHGRHAADAGAVRLDDERLDRRLGPRPAYAAGRYRRCAAGADRPGLPRRHVAVARQHLPADGHCPRNGAAGLNRLALLGQVIHDLPGNVYRWRQVMPGPLTPSQLGPENPETEAARHMVARGEAVVVRDEQTPSGLRLLAGRLPGHDVEALVNGDGQIMRGKCNCSHHYKNGLRKGPCRHLQALRNKALGTGGRAANLDRWFTLYWK